MGGCQLNHVGEPSHGFSGAGCLAFDVSIWLGLPTLSPIWQEITTGMGSSRYTIYITYAQCASSCSESRALQSFALLSSFWFDFGFGFGSGALSLGTEQANGIRDR